MRSQDPSKLRLVRSGQTELDSPCVATIGNFDGLHRGHYSVIEKVLTQAQTLKLIPTVITFDPLPQRYLNPEKSFLKLMPLRQKIQLLSQWGVRQVVCLRFNQTLATMQPEDFIRSYLVEKLKVKCLVVGENFRFGYQQKGSIETLRQVGSSLDFEVVPLSLEGEISSTQIRHALIAGDLNTARKMLGRHYKIESRVIKGKQQGRLLGFPTANLVLDSRSQLKGVFIVRVILPQKRNYFGVMNMGTRPTLDGKNYLAEVYLLDFEGDLYGKRLQVELLHKLRDEIRFDTKEQLRQQISADVENAKVFIQRVKNIDFKCMDQI